MKRIVWAQKQSQRNADADTLGATPLRPAKATLARLHISVAAGL